MGYILIKNNIYYQVQQTPKTLRQLLAYEDIAFVYHAYEIILKRKPDIDGLKHHLRYLRWHGKKTLILIHLGTSKEAQERNIMLDSIYNSNQYRQWLSLPFLEKHMEQLMPDHRSKNIYQKQIPNDIDTNVLRNLSPYTAKIYK